MDLVALVFHVTIAPWVVFSKVGVEPIICDATDAYNRLHAEIMSKRCLTKISMSILSVMLVQAKLPC